MSSAGTIVPQGGLVLITGVNGFVGSHIASELLGLRYRVRGTVRSTDKAAWIQEVMKQRHGSPAFETVIVPDVTAKGAWDEALHGVDGIIHVATDVTFGADPNLIIPPMVDSVRDLLRAAAKCTDPPVKRFVYTSSDRAMWEPVPGKKITLSSDIWNEPAVTAAWRPPPYESDRIWDVYGAQKTECEKEFWRFGNEEKPGFAINSILPSLVSGPIMHPKQGGSTGRWVADFWKDPSHYQQLQSFGPTYFVDSRDIALLHISALVHEDVKNERLLGYAETFNYNSWLHVFRQLDPSKDWPADDPKQGHLLTTVDTSREVELLKRFGLPGWTSFFESVRRACLEGRG